MRKVVSLLLLLLVSQAALAADALTLGTRVPVASKALGETREYSVYLPPSYASAATRRYPVMYVIDGDYHFEYLAGLVEQMSVSGEQIPEMIVVALGERGKTAYRHEVSPARGEKPGGAEKLRTFIASEWIADVERRYRAANYRMLVGQSMGGLFVVDTLLEQPELFDVHVAISPSLWWNDYAMLDVAKQTFAAKPALTTRLWLTHANERQMGVLDFASLLDRAAPKGLAWKYRRFDDENHGSVTIPALQWTLRQEFAGFELTSEKFRAMKSADDLVAHYVALKDRLGFEPVLPPTMLSNVFYAWQSEKKTDAIDAFERGVAQRLPQSVTNVQLVLAELELGESQWQRAHERCSALAKREPASFDARVCTAKAAKGLGRDDEATRDMRAALALAQRHPPRQWRINQLRADARELGITQPATP